MLAYLLVDGPSWSVFKCLLSFIYEIHDNCGLFSGYCASLVTTEEFPLATTQHTSSKVPGYRVG
jgi:hypothetical protein